MDKLTWLQQRESMLRHTSSLKGVLIVVTEIFRSRHRNKLIERNEVTTQLLSRDRSLNTNAKKLCRDITNWVTTGQVSLTQKSPIAIGKMGRQTSYVATRKTKSR